MSSLSVKYKTMRKEQLGKQKTLNCFEKFVEQTFSDLEEVTFKDFLNETVFLKRELLSSVNNSKYLSCQENVKNFKKESLCGGATCLAEPDNIKKDREYLLKEDKIVNEYCEKWKAFCSENLVKLISKKILKEVEERTFNRLDIVSIAKKYAKAIKLGVKTQKICGVDFPPKPFTVRSLAELLQKIVVDCGSWEYVFATGYINGENGYKKSDIKKIIKKDQLNTDDLKMLGRFEAGIKRAIYIKANSEGIYAINLIRDKAILKLVVRTIDERAGVMADCARRHAKEEFGVNSLYYKHIDKMEESVFRRVMKIENSKLKKKIVRFKKFESIKSFTYQMF